MVRVLKHQLVNTKLWVTLYSYNLRPDGEGTETLPRQSGHSTGFTVTTYDPMVRVLKLFYLPNGTRNPNP